MIDRVGNFEFKDDSNIIKIKNRNTWKRNVEILKWIYLTYSMNLEL